MVCYVDCPEKLHFSAYKNMCLSYGLQLPWTFQEFLCQLPIKAPLGLREQISLDLPELFSIQPDWSSSFCAQKKAEYKKICRAAQHELLPRCCLNL
jgi:hypothetical protein